MFSHYLRISADLVDCISFDFVSNDNESTKKHSKNKFYSVTSFTFMNLQYSFTLQDEKENCEKENSLLKSIFKLKAHKRLFLHKYFF